MHDHPIFGVVLFAIGAALASYSYFGSFDGIDTSNHIPSIVAGNIIALNGVLYLVLGYRKLLLSRGLFGMTR